MAVDIGCGSGQVALELSPYFDRVVGIDVSEAMVEEAIKAKKARGVDNVEFWWVQSMDLNTATSTVVVCHIK